MPMTLDKHTSHTDLNIACSTPVSADSAVRKAAGAAGAERVAMRVHTTRFGLIEVDEELVITFTEGLIGFENCTRYLVVSQGDNTAFRWLQSLDSPPVAFPVVEPGALRPDYAPTISDSDAR